MCSTEARTIRAVASVRLRPIRPAAAGLVLAVALACKVVLAGVGLPKSVTMVEVGAVAPAKPPPEVAAAERQILDLLNGERRQRGLKPLAWSDPVAAVARGHAQDMRAHKFVEHQSPTTGGPEDRLKAAGLRFPLILENVGFAADPPAVHRALMNSPGHRANILNKDVSHVGIGLALDTSDPKLPALFVTQLFVLQVGEVNVGEQRERVRAAVAGRRQSCGAAAAAADSKLDGVAQDLAELMAKTGGHPPAATTNAIMGRAAAGGRKVSAVISIAADATEVTGDDRVCERGEAVGIGIAQGSHPGVGENVVYAVVLLAQKT